MIKETKTQGIGQLLLRGLFGLGLCLTACAPSDQSVSGLGDEVGNGAFGVVDGSPFHITAPEGGPFPEGSRTYTLVNYTLGLFAWEIETSVPWLTSDVPAGALAPGATVDVTVSIDTAFAETLTVGDYPADLIFRDRSDPSGILIMAFLLTVEPAPTGDLRVTPEDPWELEALTLAELEGQTQVYTITNEGTGELEWAAASQSGWLLLTGDAQGVLAEGASQELTAAIATGNLSEGSGIHMGSIAFSNSIDQADTQTTVVTLRVGEQPDGRISDGLVALYDFEELSGTVAHDLSGLTPSMDLEIISPGSSNWGAGTLGLDSSAVLTSGGAATRINSAISTSNELTLEAWVTPANVTQDGPARLISLSADAHNRNVTLGQGLWGTQASDTFTTRLRSTETDTNGFPALDTDAGAASVGLLHVVYTRSMDGQTCLYVNGVTRAVGQTGGNLSNWSSDYPLVIGNEVNGGRHWDGRLHLAAVYERALADFEVQQNFTAGTGDATGPVLVASPSTGFTASGTVGQSVSPTSFTYEVRNTGTALLEWNAYSDSAWVEVLGSGTGSVAPGETQDLVIQLVDAQVGALTAGSYNGLLFIDETTTGVGSTTRNLHLTLNDPGGSGGSGGGSNNNGEWVKPGPDNTGPTNPSILVPSGSITVTQNGTVIENVSVSGTITVKAANVTIRNFRINGGGNSNGGGAPYGINVKNEASNVLIEDGEIFGIDSSGLLGADYTARRLNIHHSGGDAIKTNGNNLVESCWIHHLGMNVGSHADGNQTRSGDNIVFRGNFIDMPINDSGTGPGAPFKSNAAAINQAASGNITNVLFDSNWMNGGNYTIWITTKLDFTFDGCTVINNRFGRDYRYGPLRTNGNLTNINLSGNVWDDTGELMDINN